MLSSITSRTVLESKPLNFIYKGVVKDVLDEHYLGRLKVWIPELSGDPNDSNGWILVTYASPFAGSTPKTKTVKGSKYTDSQRSYGMWMIPPDRENEVLVCFLNGEPTRGVWFACFYQNYMNHMVPGIPGQNTTAAPPVGEYNKRVAETTPGFDIPNAQRPTYDPLNLGLETQGLIGDTIRGISDSGARRPSSYQSDNQGENSSGSVFGVLTPQGQQFVMDDSATNQFIRLRTKTGTQILINDTTGCIYMISRDGESWMELSANGAIDMYAGADISIRSKRSINLRADGDFNVDAGGSINMVARAAGGINMDAPAGVYNLNTQLHINMTTKADSINQLANQNVKVTAQTGAIDVSALTTLNMSSGTNTNITTGADRFDTVAGTWNRKAGQSILDGAASIQHLASVNIILTAPAIYANPGVINMGGGPSAAQPASASAPSAAPAAGLPTFYNLRDYGGTAVSVAVRRMPYHEPYPDHGTGSASGKASSLSSAELAKTPIDPSVFSGVAASLPPVLGNYPGVVQPGADYALWLYQGPDQNGEPQYKKGDTPAGLFNEVDFYQGMSPDGLSLLINNEGTGDLSSRGGGPGRTYADVRTGKPTIGYGHTLLPDEAAGWYVNIGGQKIPVDRVVNRQWVAGNPDNPGGVPALTSDQMSALLLQDVNGKAGYAAEVRNDVRPLRYNGQPLKLTQNQFDVLVDLHYNGQPQWKVVLDAVTRGEGYKIPALITSDPPLNRDLPGLKTRGYAEARWWTALPAGFTYGSVDSNIVENDVIILAQETVKFNKLQPYMQKAMLTLAKRYKDATGKKLIINSAYRTQEEQKVIYDLWLKYGGGPNKPTVNVPGSGNITVPSEKVAAHGDGIACDVNQTQVAYSVQNGLLADLGLFQPNPNVDPIHIQYRSGVQAKPSES